MSASRATRRRVSPHLVLEAPSAAIGATAWWSSPQEVTAFRASEEKRLGELIRNARITLDE